MADLPVVELRPAFGESGSLVEVYVDGKLLGKLVTGDRRTLIEVSDEAMRQQETLQGALRKAEKA